MTDACEKRITLPQCLWLFLRYLLALMIAAIGILAGTAALLFLGTLVIKWILTWPWPVLWS